MFLIEIKAFLLQQRLYIAIIATCWSESELHLSISQGGGYQGFGEGGPLFWPTKQGLLKVWMAQAGLPAESGCCLVLWALDRKFHPCLKWRESRQCECSWGSVCVWGVWCVYVCAYFVFWVISFRHICFIIYTYTEHVRSHISLLSTISRIILYIGYNLLFIA